MPNKTQISTFATVTLAQLLTNANADPIPQDNNESPWTLSAGNATANPDWGFPGLWPGIIFSAITIISSAVYVAKNCSQKKREGNWTFGGAALFGTASFVISLFCVWSYGIAANKDDPNDNSAYGTMSIVQLVLMVLALTGIASKAFEGRQCCTKVGGNANERRTADEQAPLLANDGVSRGSTMYGAPATGSTSDQGQTERARMQKQLDDTQKLLDEQKEARHKAEIAAEQAKTKAAICETNQTKAYAIAWMQSGGNATQQGQPFAINGGGGATGQLTIQAPTSGNDDQQASTMGL